MTTIVLDDDLMNQVVQIANYPTPQEAVAAILSDYVQTHQSQKTPFDKLRVDVGLTNEEIDELFSRNKDMGRTIEL